MISALRSHFTRAVIQRKARVFVVAVFVLTVLGPLGTYEEFSLVGRAVYWGTLILVNGAIFEFVVPSFLYSHSLSLKFSRWYRFGFGVLTGSFMATWIVVLLERVASEPLEPSVFPFVFLSVTIIASIICVVSFMPPFAQPLPLSSGPEIDFQRIEFFQKHPNLNGTRILWVQMEGHYARVATDRQKELLHITMSDLEKQLKNYPGMRIQRSNWVALDQVRGVSRQGRAMHVTMSDGTDLPVGNTYRKFFERRLEEGSFAKFCRVAEDTDGR